MNPTKQHTPLPDTHPLNIYLDGLDASMDGRGFGEQRLKAFNLLKAVSDLLAVLEEFAECMRAAPENTEQLLEIARTARASIAKAKGDPS